MHQHHPQEIQLAMPHPMHGHPTLTPEGADLLVTAFEMDEQALANGAYADALFMQVERQTEALTTHHAN